jgi:hypothetical protein
MALPYSEMVHFFRDHISWCAVFSHFSDEETSPIGRGDTIQDAADDLGEKSGRWSAAGATSAKGAPASHKTADEHGKKAWR